jgi:hypothetical protein
MRVKVFGIGFLRKKVSEGTMITCNTGTTLRSMRPTQGGHEQS